MNRRNFITFVFAAFLLLQAVACWADDRKVKSQVAPVYSEIARRAKLSGTVRLELTIEANGSVSDAKILGGNPLLAQSAVDAVKRWKYEAGKETSTTVVTFNFAAQ